MKSLEKESGLKISLKGNKLFDEEKIGSSPMARTFSESERVYVERANPQRELYYMYRYFERPGDKSIFEENDVEYDITVIKSGKVGKEFIKTKGHYHSLVPGTDISYPEVYEVVCGEIEYLIQTRPNTKKETEVVIIKASAGDKVLVPPGYGHVSVNVGAEVAVSSNLQKRDLPAGADYGGFESYRGGAMYRTAEGWKKNAEYVIKSIKYVRPREIPKWGLEKSISLYTSFIKNPKKFDYIVRPQNHDFSGIWIEDNSATLEFEI